jgi:tetratricopeptide (TPR) repeat protein
VTALVSAAALLAVGVVVAAALLQRDDAGLGATPTVAFVPDAPALELAVIDRDDKLARGLRNAERQYEEDDPLGARIAFQKLLEKNPDSIEAQIGDAVTAWPDGTAEQLQAIVDAYPDSAVARLNLGLALLADGDPDAAREQWTEAEKREPDTPAALSAEDLLNPHSPPGRPAFVVEDVPVAISKLPLRKRLATVRRNAEERGTVDDWILLGSALETTGHRESARRAYAKAVEADPESLEAQVAAAVASFDKDEPSPAFSALGPLAAANPNSALIRFHLGLMLLWLPDLDEARDQLERAQASDQEGFYGQQAGRVLARLAAIE